jgi:hypothetical protein
MTYLTTHWRTILGIGVFSVGVPMLVAWLTIKFGPDRKEVSRLRSLLEGMEARQQKEMRLTQFRCTLSLEDKQMGGSKVTFKADTPFRLLQVEMASSNGAPTATVDVNSGLGTEHVCTIPYELINGVYWSTPGSSSARQAMILYSVEADGVILPRKRSVGLTQCSFTKPGDTTQYMYIAMN